MIQFEITTQKKINFFFVNLNQSENKNKNKNIIGHWITKTQIVLLLQNYLNSHSYSWYHTKSLFDSNFHKCFKYF